MAVQALPHLLSLSGALYDWSNQLGYSVGFGCCLLAVLCGTPRLRRRFQWAPLCWIGAISYSLYMWHLPLLATFAAHVGPSLTGLPTYVVYASYWIWAALVVIPAAGAMYVPIEQPGMRLSDRLQRRLKARHRRETQTITTG